MKVERIGSSEMSAVKAQTPGDYPKNTMRHSTRSESLKSYWENCITSYESSGLSPCVACMYSAALILQDTFTESHTLHSFLFLRLFKTALMWPNTYII